MHRILELRSQSRNLKVQKSLVGNLEDKIYFRGERKNVIPDPKGINKVCMIFKAKPKTKQLLVIILSQASLWQACGTSIESRS